MADKSDEYASTAAKISLDNGSTYPLVARNWFLNQYFPKSTLTLSKSITQLKWQEQISETIRANMDNGAQLLKLSKDLSQYTTEEDVSGSIREIERIAKKIIGGDTSEYAAFQKLARKVESDAEEMIQANAPSKLGKAYARVVKAAESLKEDALDAAIDNAIEKKALSNAFRLATTEINKAINLGEYTQAQRDDDCLGMEIVLSSAGNNCEDCVDLAETDNGAGPGVWPMDQVPFLPAHPRCRCLVLPVYKIPDKTDPDFSASDDYDGEFMPPIPDDVYDEISDSD